MCSEQGCCAAVCVQVNLKAGHVEYNRFYIPDITTLVDIQEDYLKWFLSKAEIVSNGDLYVSLSCDDVVLWNLVCVCVSNYLILILIQWDATLTDEPPSPYPSSLPLSPCIVESVELCRPFLGRAQRLCCPHPHIFTFVPCSSGQCLSKLV